MKKLLLSTLLITTHAFAYYGQAEFTAGQASVEGDPMNSYTGSLGFYEDKFYGSFGWGLGVRLSRYTASEYQPSSKRTEALKDINLMSTNIFGQIHYDMNNWKFGFNLDLIGSSSGDASTILGSSNEVNPVTNNIFLYGKNDKGSLNSQLFARYNLDQWFLKAGLAHTVVEYEDDFLGDDERRQRFFDSFFIGLGIKL